jgi:hypothetical protein
MAERSAPPRANSAVNWVGASVFALGVGAAIVSMPSASADTGDVKGAAHSNSASAGAASKPSTHAGPKRTQASPPSVARQAVSLKQKPVKATRVAKAAATPAAEPSVWTDLARQVGYVFFNRAPSVAPTQSWQTGAGKQIDGDLNALSNNEFDPTYSIKEYPKYGQLALDEATGKYTYTPDSDLVRPGISDRFTLAVDNGATAELPGLAGVVQKLLHGLAISLGAAQPDSIDRQITVTVTGDRKYGDRANAQWWDKQSYQNCVLMAAATAIGQVTGTKPTEQEMVDLAKATDSVVAPGQKMYLDENIAWGVYTKDAVVLMEKYFDVTAVYAQYGQFDGSGNQLGPATAEDGQRALNDLAAALAQGKAAMVSINSTTVWTSVRNYTPSGTPNWSNRDHQVEVIAVDLQAGKVYLNDSGVTYGQGMEVSLGTFLNAWQPSNHELTIVSANSPAAASV